MQAPRCTAKEIEDGLYCGMDPDVELVAAQYYDALTAERDELQRRLDAVVKWVQQTETDGTTYAVALAIAEGRDNG